MVTPFSFFASLFPQEPLMSHAHSHVDTAAQSSDPAESVIGHMPVVLPVAGGVMIFLLAFIAVFMA
jgi:hypothetical protein